jgi:Predicted hydrolase (metallo-beta-lactamase superfamily)
MTYTAYELEFLPVGNGERSGDAIVGRFILDDGSWRTLVVDGGTKESGHAIVEHVRGHYGTNRINDVVNTHPDADHASGLRVVLEQMDVDALWMHHPWDHSFDIRHAFDDARLTGIGLASRMRSALVCAHELHELAEARGILRIEPFFGAQIGPFTVLSPTLPNHQALLPHFRCTPEPAQKPKAQSGTLGDYLKDIFSQTAENWSIETLSEGGQTRPLATLGALAHRHRKIPFKGRMLDIGAWQSLACARRLLTPRRSRRRGARPPCGRSVRGPRPAARRCRRRRRSCRLRR